MRILFAGTPEIAVPSLERIAGNFNVCGVLTNPDRVRARGNTVLPSPVKTAAEALGLTVVQPQRLLRDAREQIIALEPDLLVTFAYGRIFGPKFLSLFPEGGINIHPSLLPALRGSSPIQSAILMGLPETGITIQNIALEMDTGAVLRQDRIRLHQTETTESLTKYVSVHSATMVVDVILDIMKGTVQPKPQNDDDATYCTKIEKADRVIDWTRSATQLSREIRAYYPWPKAATVYNGKSLMLTFALPAGPVEGAPGTVLENPDRDGILIACGEGSLKVTHLQLEAKKEVDWKAFLNGNSGFIGTKLG